VKNTEWLALSSEVLIQPCCPLQRSLVEDLGEAVCRLLCDASTLAEGFCHLNSSVLSGPKVLNESSSVIDGCDLLVYGREDAAGQDSRIRWEEIMLSSSGSEV
jgi:hypothetical protein